MEENDETTDLDQSTVSGKVQFAKLIVSAAAAYAATKLSEHAIDALIRWRRSKAVEDNQ